MKYFKNPTNIEELKQEYKSLAKMYHPDLNKDGLEHMKEVNNEYEKLFNMMKDEKTSELAGDYVNVINELMKYGNIEIEIIGSWIWLHGKTYEIKEELKKLGFRWSKGKKLWYLNPSNDGKSHRYKQNDLSKIRNTYGSKIIKSNSNTCIA